MATALPKHILIVILCILFACPVQAQQTNRLFAFGEGSYGQLGTGNTNAQHTPVQTGTARNWLQISAGYRHSLAIRADGTLWGWGDGAYGRLGTGNTNAQYTPIQIGTATNWKQVSAGWFHSLAIRADGTLWAWGSGYYGELGMGNTNDQYSPVQIGTANNWQQVSTGNLYSLAIRSDGTLWAWGYGGGGELGTGNTNHHYTPVQIGTANNWQQVSGGESHSLAVKSDGTLWAWGYGDYGALGTGYRDNQHTPVQIGRDNNWQQVSAGAAHSLALKSDGTLWAWGYGLYGQLGTGSTYRYTPIQIGTAIHSFVAAGYYHSLALRVGVCDVPTGQNITLYVDGNVSVSGSGCSWASPLKTLKEAFDLAKSEPLINRIMVAKGTYYPTGAQNGIDRNATFLIRQNGGIKLYGGYPNGGGTRDIKNNPTILSGDIGTLNSNADNSYHVLAVTNTSAGADSVVVDGFTITKGNANGTATYAYNVYDANQNEGAGILLRQNANLSGKLSIRNSIVTDNQSTSGGAGIYFWNTAATLAAVVVSGNTSGSNGGGLFLYQSPDLKLINSVVANNQANQGGGIFTNASSAQIVNGTFAYNTATANGHSIFNNNNSTITATNSIFWSDNAASNLVNNATLNITYSNIQGGYAGTNNINTDPLFINANNGDYALQATSPAIAKGNNNTFTGLNAATTDLAGNLRVYSYVNGGTIDMGAYEYQGLAKTALSNFADITKTYGDADFALTAPTSNSNGAFTYSSSNENVATVSGSTITVVGVGTATITAMQQSDSNYDTGTKTLTLTVNKASQTISFAALDPKTTTSADFTLGATATSGLAISYTSSNTAVAEVYQDAGVWKVKIIGAGNTNITAIQNGNGDYSAATAVVQQLIVVGAPLPVTLMSYIAKAEGNHAKLEWKTTSETNNKGFEIYRSGDDKQFVKIGEVSATIGHQLSTIDYTFTDKNPLNGNNYYKLVQVDIEGKPTELDVRPLNFALPTSDIRLFPNPATDRVTVTYASGKYQTLSLISIGGKLFRSSILDTAQSETVVDLSVLPAGIYLMKLEGGNASEVKKIIKQ